MFFNKKNIYFIVIFLTIFTLDRISKIFVINNYETTGNSRLFSSMNLNLDLVWNKGIAFGLFSFSSINTYNFITIIILAIILGVFYMFIYSKKSEKIFYLIVFSGAVGNFYDRILFKAVPDFIDIHINNIHWFVFNVSDIFITLGVLGLIFNEILKKKL